MEIIALMPVLDDWASAQEVVRQLGQVFAATPHRLAVLLVDDGSEQPVPGGLASAGVPITILKLKKNLGSQRALAVGMCHILDKLSSDAVLVMDSDGEDDAGDALRLVERLEQEQAVSTLAPIVFAERTVRTESRAFRLGYFGYRVAHQFLTGRGIRVGNFSIMPHGRLAAVTADPKLWNHYAAAVLASRLPHVGIPSRRGRRIEGKSRLNYIGFVIHGLSALSCYSEIIGTRMIFFSTLLFGLALTGIAVVIGLKLFTLLWLPGWTSTFAALLLILLLQVVTLASNFTLQIMSTRTAQPFLPIRDYVWFVESVTPLRVDG